jgi:hypothetical protein
MLDERVAHIKLRMLLGLVKTQNQSTICMTNHCEDVPLNETSVTNTRKKYIQLISEKNMELTKLLMRCIISTQNSCLQNLYFTTLPHNVYYNLK